MADEAAGISAAPRVESSTRATALVAGPDWTLLSQGAEARVWKVPNFKDDQPAIAKERFSKAYRHPVLDARLTKQRCRAEARILDKCLKKGLTVPQVLDTDGATIYMEFVDAPTVRDHLESLLNEGSSTDAVAVAMGTVIARLHGLGVIHGDLTSSNMLWKDESLLLIDFGLAKNTDSAEERAVDWYVLERALSSTHPRLPTNFLELCLAQYDAGPKTQATLDRLEQVRLRGRKRECFG